MAKEWHEAINWDQRNEGYGNHPFALLGCPCNQYSHYCTLAEERALADRLAEALKFVVPRSQRMNAALATYEEARRG